MRFIVVLKGVVGGLYALGTSVGISKLISNRCNEGKNDVSFQDSYRGVSLEAPIITNTDHSLPIDPVWTGDGPLLTVQRHGVHIKESGTRVDDAFWTASGWPTMETCKFIAVLVAPILVPIWAIACGIMEVLPLISTQTRHIFIESLMTHVELMSAETSSLGLLAYYGISWWTSYARIQDLAAWNERLQASLSTSETDLKKSQSTIKRKDAQRGSLERDIRSKEDLIRQYTRDLDGQRQTSQRDLDEKNREITNLQAEIRQVREALDRKSASENRKQKTISDLISDRDKAGELHRARTSEYNKYRTENATLKEELKRARDTGLAMMDKANKLKGQLADVEARLEAANAASAEAETESDTESSK